METRPDPIYRQLIVKEFNRRKEKNPRYSLRAFSKSLLVDSGALSQILSGKRVPSTRVAKKILRGLSLMPINEWTFWKSLAATHGQQTDKKRMSPFLRKFLTDTQFQPGHPENEREISFSEFEKISNWYHIAILELSTAEDFVVGADAVSRILSLEKKKAHEAISRLIEVGLLAPDSENRLRKTSVRFTTADKTSTSLHHRRHQKEMLAKAIHSLDSDPIQQRNHSGMTMAIDPEKIAFARQMIEDFSGRLCDFLESGKRKKVYQLNVALFPLHA